MVVDRTVGRARAWWSALAVVMATAGPALAQGQVPDPCDFVTSGGFVITDSGKKASFGAHGGCKHEEFWGNVNLVDHETGYHVNGSEITAYIAPFGAGDPTRDICGLATTNRASDPQPMRFRIRVVDNGEPGREDLFGILLAKRTSMEGDPVETFEEAYRITPRLLSATRPGGGNVQLHEPNASTTAPPGSIDEQTACGGLTFGATPPPD